MNNCRYFILLKNKTDPIYDNTNNEIINIEEKKLTYILPYNNINYLEINGLFENTLIEWAKQFCNKDKTFLDIGAHTGTYAISYAKYSKIVYAFEPQRKTYYALCGGVSLSNIDNIICYNYGLGSKDQVGECILNIISEDGGGSTLKDQPKNEILDTEKIEIKTLDSLELDNIGFIKIDVENNELEVLQGGILTLQRSNYPKILFEMNEYNKNIILFLEQYKYKIIKINGYKNMFLAET